MNYNFDHVADHRYDASYRWQQPDGLDDVIGMGTADLDYDCAPCIREALLPVAQENCYNYRQRTARYYNAVTDWYARQYGLHVQQEWLSNVPSTIGAIRMALSIMAKPGDYVLVQTPCFGPISRCIEGSACCQLDNPMQIVNGRYELDFEDFEKKLRWYHPAVFLLVNPHNPTCRVFTKSELERLVSLCATYHVRIVSDEVHSLILYDGVQHTPILSVSAAAQQFAIQVVSLSKGYNIMSLPHAIVTISNDELRAAWDRQIQSYSFGYAVNSFALAAVTTILEGNADMWMQGLQQYLQKNRDDLLHFFAEQQVPVHAFCPQSSFLMWVDCRDLKVPEDQLGQYFLEKAHISLDDGAEFGPDGIGFVRINFAVTNQVLKQAISRMKSCWELNQNENEIWTKLESVFTD